MDASLIDSRIYGHNWTTPESVALFSEPTRLARWLTVIQALADAQASLGMIPAPAAGAIAAIDPQLLDVDQIAARTRSTAHSTLGFIQVLQELLPEEAREYIYYGATVQDISDTAASIELVAVSEGVWRDLWIIEGLLLDLAATHRVTPMLGRTHGQPGAPISFGFKVAGWADEIGRSLERLKGRRAHWSVGQLAGAVGALAFHGPDGLELRRRLCERLELVEPAISWTSSRDRIAEFGAVLAIAATSLQRIAKEIYNLQREEIGEVSEGTTAQTIGSITMPHKRNPENSEQIVTLGRLLRAASLSLTDSMAGDHERDGSTWKTEWMLLPQIGHYALASTALSISLIEGLSVNTSRMEANLNQYGFADSQELLRRLSSRLGKHNAQAELARLYRAARDTRKPLSELLSEVATADELRGLDVPALGSAPDMVDAVVAAANERRADESLAWA